jgi:hypothetical protein
LVSWVEMDRWRPPTRVLSSGISQAVQGDWSWRNVMASAVARGVGAGVDGALSKTALSPRSVAILEVLAARWPAGSRRAWRPVGRSWRTGELLSNVFASALGNALGGSIAYADWGGGSQQASAGRITGPC